MVKGDIVAARTHVTALFIHFRQGVDLVGVVDGSAYQPQARHGAARGLDLRKDHEGDDDRHQRVRQRHGAVQEKERRRAHDEHGKEVQAQALRDVVGREKLLNGQIALAVVFKRLPQPPVALAPRD